MKLKQILQNNNVDLKEHYYEEAIHIKDSTPKKILDIILSSDEFKLCKEIKPCNVEDMQNLQTLLLTNSVELNENIKLNMVSFGNNEHILLRLTKGSIKSINNVETEEFIKQKLNKEYDSLIKP
jgi:hypothetical protein